MVGLSFQTRVGAWMDVCFGEQIKRDRLERADRFIEEALELCQTEPTFTADRAHALVEYVFGRTIGEPRQEVGGVRVTLAALCNAVGIDEDDAAEAELARIWTKVDAIRAKQAAKPTGSALPVAAPDPQHLGQTVTDSCPVQAELSVARAGFVGGMVKGEPPRIV
jgi:hypothetical protein